MSARGCRRCKSKYRYNGGGGNAGADSTDDVTAGDSVLFVHDQIIYD
jgi:hypothetical protein